MLLMVIAPEKNNERGRGGKKMLLLSLSLTSSPIRLVLTPRGVVESRVINGGATRRRRKKQQWGLSLGWPIVDDVFLIYAEHRNDGIFLGRGLFRGRGKERDVERKREK